MKNIEPFLKKLGIKSAIIAKVIADEELPATTLDTLVSEQREVFSTALRNDPEFLNPIKDEITGKERSIIEGKIKKTFGLTSEEVKDKKLDEIVTIALEKVKANSTGTAQEIQDKLLAAQNEIKRLTEVVLPETQAAAETKILNYEKGLALRDHLANREFLVPQTTFMRELNDRLSGKYKIEVKDGKVVTFTTPEGLKPLAADKSKEITFEEALEMELTDMKVLKQSQGAPPEVIPGSLPNPAHIGAHLTMPGLAAAKANAESLKTVKTFGQ